MQRRIVFHVGLAKTGTTSFQHACRRHRRLLARHGVLYPRATLGSARNHSPLAASYLAHRPRDPTIALKVATRASAVAALRAEIDTSPCPVALVSSEHFSIHFDTHEAYQLAEDFEAYDPQIVIALREPYGRFLSMWNTHVTAGGRLTLGEFGQAVLVPDNRFISLRETLLIWREAFGPKRVHIVDYDGAGDIAAAILDRCGARIPLPPGKRRRESLPPEAIEALRCVNATIAARQTAPPDSLAAWAQLSFFSVLSRWRLPRGRSGAVGPIVSPETMAALDAIFEGDRAWLSKTYGQALDGAAARERYIIGDVAPSSDAQMLLAETLFREVSRGMWAPSQMLVELWDMARRWR